MTPPFLSQDDPYGGIGEGFREFTENQPFELVLVVLGGLLSLFVIVYFIHSRWTGGGTTTPVTWSLFKELCRANRLSFSEKNLLRNIVRASGNPDPAQVFLRQTIFDAGISRTPGKQEVADSLRRKLYRP